MVLGGLITFILTVFFGPAILIVTLVIVIVEITTQNNQNAQSIGMTILTWLAHLVWLLVRAAILIFAWIVFAFIFLFANIMLISIIGIALLLDIFMEVQYEIKINEIKVTGAFDLIMGYNIDLDHIEFFDIDIPVINIYFGSSDFILGYSSTFFSNNIGFSKFPDNLFEDIFDSNQMEYQTETSIDNLHTSSSENDISVTDILVDFFISFGSGVGIASTTVCIIAALNQYVFDEKYKKAITIISFIAYIATLVILGLLIAQTDSNQEKGITLLGYGYGIFLASMFFYLVGDYISNNAMSFMGKIYKTIGALGKYPYILATKILLIAELMDFLGTLMSLFLDFSDVSNLIDWDNVPDFKTGLLVFTTTTGALALFLAFISLLMFGSHYDKGLQKKIGNNKRGYDGSTKADFSLLFGIGGMLVGLIFLNVGYRLLLTPEES